MSILEKKRKSYFKRFKCFFCKKQATTYCIAGSNNRYLIICDDKECNTKAQLKLGFLKLGLEIEK